MRSETINPKHFSSAHSAVRILLLGMMMLLGSTGQAFAADLSLAWNPVSYNGAIVYEVHYGNEGPRQYTFSQSTSNTSATLTNLALDNTYYATVRACTEDRTQCSAFSSEVSQTIANPPVVNFTANRTSGEAPLTVSLSAVTSGMIDTLNWQFGDAANSTDNGGSNNTSTQFTYTQPGTYSVTLVASGPGGDDQEMKTGLIVVTEPSMADNGGGGGDDYGGDNAQNQGDQTVAHNDLAVDFGDERGIWVYLNESTWMHLMAGKVHSFEFADLDGDGVDEFIMLPAFSSGVTVWKSGVGWYALHDNDAESLHVSDIDGNGQEDLIIDFGERHGLWAYANESTWIHIATASPTTLISTDLEGDGTDDLILTFPQALGLYTWNNRSGWAMIREDSPTILKAADLDGDLAYELVTSIDGEGTFIFSKQTGWRLFNNLESRLIEASDLNGDGLEEVILVPQTSEGTIAWSNGAGWSLLHERSAESMTTFSNLNGGQEDLIVDFGKPHGIWAYRNDSYWAQILASSAARILAVGLDNL
jgi:PKD repeat protein